MPFHFSLCLLILDKTSSLYKSVLLCICLSSCRNALRLALFLLASLNILSQFLSIFFLFSNILNAKSKYFEEAVDLFNQNKLDEAIEVFNRALSIKPDYVEAYNNLGIVLKKQNKIDKAIDAYTRAISINSSYVVSYYNLGNLYSEQGKLEKALKLYREAISIKPDYSEAYCNIGVVLKDLGQ